MFAIPLKYVFYFMKITAGLLSNVGLLLPCNFVYNSLQSHIQHRVLIGIAEGHSMLCVYSSAGKEMESLTQFCMAAQHQTKPQRILLQTF